MDVFGLTPIDSAIEAWGLNCSQKITDYLFFQTSIGILAFAIGFVGSVWQSAQNANFKYFFIFIGIFLISFLLFIIPQRQEPTIKSAVEVYGKSELSAQVIKASQTNDHTMPLMLSFIVQMADAISIGTIFVVDASLNSDLRFLSNPFGVQRLSLQSYQFINSPINDVGLRRDLDEFSYTYYLPALSMYINSHQVNSLKDFWIGDLRIVRNYSQEGNQKWQEIKSRLLDFIKDPQNPWEDMKNILRGFSISVSNLDDQIMSSIIRGQHFQSDRLWIQWAGSIQTYFPYLYGGANFCLFLVFPFLILALIIVRRIGLVMRYIEIFIWIKSWVLSAAFSFFISLVVAQIQARVSPDASWFWDYPYYLLVASVFLILMPILSFIGIHRSFQLINRSH